MPSRDADDFVKTAEVSIALLLDMAASADADRVAVVCDGQRLTVGELNSVAASGAGVIAACGAGSVAYVGVGGIMLPLLVFSSAGAARPFAPLNYRLSADALADLIGRLPEPLVVFDAAYRDVVTGLGVSAIESEAFVAAAGAANPVKEFPDPDDVAVVLFTSGTTSRPKAVELSHNNLTSYVLGTVEFGSAESGDTALICVPPYHIAGVSAALSNIYAGRKIVYLNNFDPYLWVRLAAAEGVTNATVVPTMLDRIITALEAQPTELPCLRTLAYGGSKVSLPLVRKCLELLPHVGLVNAYGLTETSSTIAILTPEDHRVAHAASDETARKRLGSVGQPVPGVEVQIRAEGGAVLGREEVGELYVRGDQVSGKYAEIGSVLDADGWFPTRDIAYLDSDGYLFICGRSDDIIIRGGENIAPAEVEDLLVEHPHVCDVAVVGVEDAEWGQIMVAVVVPVMHITPDAEELREHIRAHLRGSRTPDRVVFREELPTTPTGKVLRRQLAEELKSEAARGGTTDDQGRHQTSEPGV